MLIKVTHADKEWAWDINCSQEDAFRIKRETGMGNFSFHQGVYDRDPDCVQTLLWLCRRQDEPALKRRDVKFDFADFALEDIDEDADPTSEPSTKLTALSGTTSPSAPNGSAPSPGTTTSAQPITTG